jgi:hypothetical protein
MGSRDMTLNNQWMKCSWLSPSTLRQISGRAREAEATDERSFVGQGDAHDVLATEL